MYLMDLLSRQIFCVQLLTQVPWLLIFFRSYQLPGDPDSANVTRYRRLSSPISLFLSTRMKGLRSKFRNFHYMRRFRTSSKLFPIDRADPNERNAAVNADRQLR